MANSKTADRFDAEGIWLESGAIHRRETADCTTLLCHRGISHDRRTGRLRAVREWPNNRNRRGKETHAGTPERPLPGRTIFKRLEATGAALWGIRRAIPVFDQWRSNL